MALACLWQWIKPPVSPFGLHVQAVRTKNVKQGERGRNVRKEKLQHFETTPSAGVSRHSWKSKLKHL